MKDDGNLLLILSPCDRGRTLSPGPVQQPPADSPAPSGAIGAMTSRHRRRSPAAAALAVLIAGGPTLLPGCSGRTSFLSGGPTVGQLKTSVAHLEYENAQMKRDVAKLRRENRQMEDQLVQREQDNGELHARLDDARNLIRQRGLDGDQATASRAEGPRESSEGSEGMRTIPAGQSTRKRRKPPVARIPGQITPAAPDRGLDIDRDDEDGALGPPQAAPGSEADADQVGLRSGDDLRSRPDYRGPQRWAPIAGPVGDTASRVR